MEKSLIERINNLIEANPWHNSDGKFSNPNQINKEGRGSYSGDKKYQVKSSGGKPSIKRSETNTGRDSRPYPARRVQDGQIPKWARDRYNRDTLKKKDNNQEQ